MVVCVSGGIVNVFVLEGVCEILMPVGFSEESLDILGQRFICFLDQGVKHFSLLPVFMLS